MNIFNQLRSDIINAGTRLNYDRKVLELAAIEIPKDHLNGDVSTNIAMIVASKNHCKPKEVAMALKNELYDTQYIAHIEVAGPGFINFTIKASAWHQCINDILSNSQPFQYINIGNNERVNIEYVSANPTGPLHIGHARSAVYGDTLARLLSRCGYVVTKEYYINDAGSQIDALVQTVFIRYQSILNNIECDTSNLEYPGEYLIDIANALVEQYGDKLLNMHEAHKVIKIFTIDSVLSIIKEDLERLGIEHDVFFSEQSLYDNNKIDEMINYLSKIDLIYEGRLPQPKGKIPEDWEDNTQMLFRATKFGDDQDRSIKKSDGSWTYFAADVAYAKDKIDRGFRYLIYILGADHGGYVKRIKAVISALSNDEVSSDIKICQLVNFMQNGITMKMSKRNGTFITVKDMTDSVGKDIVRFLMLTRKNDVTLDFDPELTKQQSKDNPVFYVQYAFVRAVSIISNCKEHLPKAYEKFMSGAFDLSLLDSEEEIQLIKLLASWRKVLESAAKAHEPHKIAFYLLNIASKFHSIWNLGKQNNDYRFVIKGNIELTVARVAMVKSLQIIIADAFDIIGITPMTKM